MVTLAYLFLYRVKTREAIEKKKPFQSGVQVGRDSSFFHRGWVTGAFGARCFILGKGAQRNREKRTLFNRVFRLVEVPPFFIVVG